MVFLSFRGLFHVSFPGFIFVHRRAWARDTGITRDSIAYGVLTTMNDFVGWCRQLRQSTRRWGERVLLASGSSPRVSAEEEKGREEEEQEDGCVVKVSSQCCLPVAGVRERQSIDRARKDCRGEGEFLESSPVRSDCVSESGACLESGMDKVRQGSKRGINCVEKGLEDVQEVAESAHKSEESTRENIVAEIESEVCLGEEHLTTAMSKEAKQGGEGAKNEEVRGEDGSGLLRELSLQTEASRSTYSKSSTFPRSKTELLDASQLAVSVSGVVVACPPYGAKSVMGRRAKMEDTFVAIPDLIGVAFADSLNEIIPPRIADQIHQLSENDSCSTGKNSGSSGLGTAAIGGENGVDKPKADSDTIVHASSSKLVEMKRREELDLSAGAGRGGTHGAEGTSGRPKKLFEQIHFFGVFDGHGGADAAHHCQETMHERLKEAILASCPRATMERAATMGRGFLDDQTFSELEASICSSETFSNALAQAFKVTDEEFAKLSGDEEELALVGTTAVVTLLSSQSIYVANAGDSRAVLLRNGTAMALTDDHKAAREDETARVEAAGGQILFWNGVRVMGLLAVSRAIGDHSLRPYVIADPEVTVMNRHVGDELLVMASDGLWDVITNQEACSLAKKCLLRARQKGSTRENAARVAATVLTRAAVDRGSRDNVTVLVIDLMQDPDDQIDQDALKMCMSEDLRAVRRDRDEDDEENGDDGDVDNTERGGQETWPTGAIPVGGKQSPFDVDESIISEEILDSKPEARTSIESPSVPFNVAGPFTGPPPTPFMGTPFDIASTDETNDGTEIPFSTSPNAGGAADECAVGKAQSYRSPFESLGFYPSGSQEYE